MTGEDCARWPACPNEARPDGYCSDACRDRDSEDRAEQIALWSVSEDAYSERAGS